MLLHVSSTVVLIIRRSTFYYKAYGIITPVGGRPVYSLLSTCAPDGQCDDTRFFIIQFWPPDDEHNSVRNM